MFLDADIVCEAISFVVGIQVGENRRNRAQIRRSELAHAAKFFKRIIGGQHLRVAPALYSLQYMSPRVLCFHLKDERAARASSITCFGEMGFGLRAST